MKGVVLCGGQSLRMGHDKGLLVSGKEKNVWARIMKKKFSQISVSTVLSINSMQNENYLRHFDEKDLVVDSPTINIEGPLLGLLSVHIKYPDQDLMVVGCDMINMDGVVLMKLFSSHTASKTEAISFKGERIEPLCAVYTSIGLAKIYTAYRKKKLHRNSMMHVLEKLNTAYISIPDEWKIFFKNFNSAEDLITAN